MLSYNEKHLVILPYSSHLSTLIVNECHNKTLHGGIQVTLANVRRKYWIIRGKRLVQLKINKCVTCIRYKAEVGNQIMGNLLKFTHTRLDYTGPIKVRTTYGRGHKSYKGYIAIFLCFSTKATHLEVVSSMTSEAFLGAFNRFISRRGQCTHIYI
jgi:hypothetical protein